jgi:hypothetical protein
MDGVRDRGLLRYPKTGQAEGFCVAVFCENDSC